MLEYSGQCSPGESIFNSASSPSRPAVSTSDRRAMSCWIFILSWFGYLELNLWNWLSRIEVGRIVVTWDWELKSVVTILDSCITFGPQFLHSTEVPNDFTSLHCALLIWNKCDFVTNWCTDPNKFSSGCLGKSAVYRTRKLWYEILWHHPNSLKSVGDSPCISSSGTTFYVSVTLGRAHSQCSRLRRSMVPNARYFTPISAKSSKILKFVLKSV